MFPGSVLLHLTTPKNPSIAHSFPKVFMPPCSFLHPFVAACLSCVALHLHLHTWWGEATTPMQTCIQFVLWIIQSIIHLYAFQIVQFKASSSTQLSWLSKCMNYSKYSNNRLWFLQVKKKKNIYYVLGLFLLVDSY